MGEGEIRSCCRRLSIHSRLSKNKTDAASGGGGGVLGRQQLTRKDAFELVEMLYRDHPAPVWRVESRKAMELLEQSPKSSKCLIYGEVSFIAFVRILELCVPLVTQGRSGQGFTFYDLGCGAGRSVFLAPVLWHDCVKSCGIEIIPSMHDMNQELLSLYKLEVLERNKTPPGGLTSLSMIWQVLPHLHPSRRNQDISFIRGDFLQEDWSDAAIVFANATCFDDPLFAQLEKRATETMREGSIVISVTKQFSGDAWELLHRQEMKMSWASAFVHVQRKKQQQHNPEATDRDSKADTDELFDQQL